MLYGEEEKNDLGYKIYALQSPDWRPYPGVILSRMIKGRWWTLFCKPMAGFEMHGTNRKLAPARLKDVMDWISRNGLFWRRRGVTLGLFNNGNYCGRINGMEIEWEKNTAENLVA